MNKDAPTISERTFVAKALAQDLRLDGRSSFQMRPITFLWGSEYGSVQCNLGETKVLAQVSAEIVKPREDRPYEGQVVISSEISPMASAQYEFGRASDEELLLSRALDKAVRSSNVIDREALCIIAGQKVWSIRIDVHFLNDEGNLLDCASIAVLAALRHFRRPEVEVTGEEVTIFSMADRVPVPLILLHHPICLTFAFYDPLNDSSEQPIIIDPTLLETQLAGALVTLTLNAQGEISVFTKNGGISLDINVIMRVVGVGMLRVQETEEYITAQLKNELGSKMIETK